MAFALQLLTLEVVDFSHIKLYQFEQDDCLNNYMLGQIVVNLNIFQLDTTESRYMDFFV